MQCNTSASTVPRDVRFLSVGRVASLQRQTASKLCKITLANVRCMI